jgi:molecular chaperone DnaK
MINDLKLAIKNDDYEKIKFLSKNLQENLMSIGKKVYSQTNSSSQESKSTNDSVIDADFSETK